MSRPVKRFTASGAPRRATGSGGTFLGPEAHHDGMVMGVRLDDGSGMLLDGQPPPAVSKGWGNLAFLYQQHRH